MIRASFRIFLAVTLTACAAFAQAQPGGQASPPGGQASQPGGQANSSPAGPAPYGSGEKSAPRYSGNTTPRNALFFSVAEETAYDDNALSDNRNRQGDTTFGLAARLGFREERKGLTLALDYQPDALIYRENQHLNAFNQGLQMDAAWQPYERFKVRLRESLQYRRGLFSPGSGEDLMPALGAPTALNDSVVRPLARTFENNTRLDLAYQKSSRSAVTLFGGVVERDFHEATGERLRGHQGVNSGVQYVYQLSRATTLGGTYLLQTLHFEPHSRSLVQSGFFSLARRFSPGTRLDVFGGPQYARLDDRFTVELDFLGSPVQLSGRIFRTRWHAAAGGVFTRSSENTAFQITAQRIVSDGGGILIGAVSNATLGLNVRRRLARRWHASWSLELARSALVDSQAYKGTVATQSSGIWLERSLTETLTARLRYNFIHQRTTGQSPLFHEIDRNRVSFALAWQVRKIALGR